MSKYFEIHGNQIVAKNGLIISYDKFPADRMSCGILDKVYDLGRAQGRNAVLGIVETYVKSKEQG